MLASDAAVEVEVEGTAKTVADDEGSTDAGLLWSGGVHSQLRRPRAPPHAHLKLYSPSLLVPGEAASLSRRCAHATNDGDSCTSCIVPWLF